MTLLARSLAAAAFGLVSSTSHALTASPPQFTITASVTSHCMVASGVARAGFSANADASRDVIVICSKGASVGAVLLEFAPDGRGGQVSGADLQLSSIRPGVPGVQSPLACADASGVSAEVLMAPLVLCASVRDPGGAVAGRRGRIVTVMVVYE